MHEGVGLAGGWVRATQGAYTPSAQSFMQARTSQSCSSLNSCLQTCHTSGSSTNCWRSVPPCKTFADSKSGGGVQPQGRKMQGGRPRPDPRELHQVASSSRKAAETSELFTQQGRRAAPPLLHPTEHMQRGRKMSSLPVGVIDGPTLKEHLESNASVDQCMIAAVVASNLTAQHADERACSHHACAASC